MNQLGLGNVFSATPSGKLRQILDSPVPMVEAMALSVREQLTLSSTTIDENMIFAQAAFSRSGLCGKLFWADPIAGVVTEAMSRIQPTCRSLPWLAYGHAALRPGKFIVQLSSIVFLFAILLLPIMRRFAVWAALAPAAQLVLMYSTLDTAINRYGFPIYPVGVSLLVLLAVAGHARWESRRARVSNALDA